MKNFRLSKNDTAHYSSFEEAAKAFKCKEKRKHNNDENKLQEQRKKFLGTCKACHNPLVYKGGNILVCNNPDCKGLKHSIIDEKTGEEKVWYTPIFRLLDNRGEKIANHIFE